MADDTKVSGWMQTERPFWYPDARGFLLASMVIICGTALFYRMTHASEVNDKILDMMITIVFSTCLVLVYNWQFGSAADAGKTQDTQGRLVEKLTSAPPNGPVAPVPSPPATPEPWWNLLNDAERKAIADAANADPADTRLVTIATGPITMKPNPDDLAYLVLKNLLTQDRATAIQGA